MIDTVTLISQVQAGQLEPYEQVVAAHLPGLRVFVALRAPVPHLIDEIVHDSFVFAFEHIDEFSAGTNFAAWLRAIAGNLIRQAKQRFSREQANRRNYAEQLVLRQDDQASPREAGDEAAALGACLQRLSAPQRELITLKYTEDRPAEEIAQHLGRTLDWVYVNLHRLRQALKRCMESHLVVES